MSYSYLVSRIACSHSELVLVAALVVPSILIFCLCVLCCNIGGALDCIYAAHRRKQQREARLLDIESGVPLLSPTSPASAPAASLLSPQRSASASPPASRPFGFRSQQPSSSSRSQLLPSGQTGGKYQHTRPFGDPNKNGPRSTA